MWKSLQNKRAIKFSKIILLILISYLAKGEMPLKISSQTLSHYQLESLEIANERAIYTSRAHFPPDTIQLDPWHRWKFNRVLYGYVEEGDGYKLVYRLYFPSRYLSIEGKDYLPLAKKILYHALQFYIIGRKFLGNVSLWSRDGVVDIWLAEKGDAGGEQIGKDLYIYQIGKARDEIELIREVAHEWGHHIIPPIGPYKEPEKWANGYVGERLLLELLRENSPSPQEREEIEKFLNTRNQKPLEIFRKAGYPSPLLSEEGAEGFWYMVGYVLEMREKKGIEFIRRILQQTRGRDRLSPSDLGKLLASE